MSWLHRPQGRYRDPWRTQSFRGADQCTLRKVRSCGCECAGFPWPESQCPTPCPEHRQKAGESRSEEHTSELQSLMRNTYAAFCLKQKIQSPTQNCVTLTI